MYFLVRHTERRGWRNDAFSVVFAASMQQSRESAEPREVNDKMSEQDISYKSQLSDSTFPPVCCSAAWTSSLPAAIYFPLSMDILILS